MKGIFNANLSAKRLPMEKMVGLFKRLNKRKKLEEKTKEEINLLSLRNSIWILEME